MNARLLLTLLCLCLCCSAALSARSTDWWNPQWRFRTTVVPSHLIRAHTPGPVEVPVDFQALLDRAGVGGEFDPASVRVVPRAGETASRDRGQVACALRTEPDPESDHDRSYLAWMADPEDGQVPAFDIYFDTTDRGLPAPAYNPSHIPPANLVSNPGFEDGTDGWMVAPEGVASLGAFDHTTGEQSLKVTVDEQPEGEAERPTVSISQQIDVSDFAGQQMVFECDLLAKQAAYGLPICIELEQFRADGSKIPECAVQPRWLTLELAEGKRVQFRQRGRFNPEAATVQVHIEMRCYAIDADSNQTVTGPDSAFTVWLDRVVVRPGERWPWPAATNAGFVEGAIPGAPVNRGFEFTGQRRLGFNGGSEATMTTGAGDHGPQAVHWGLQQGTLEFWCRPSWDADDGVHRTFFTGYAYLYRLQSRLRKHGEGGDNQLEFAIADSNRTMHVVRGPAALMAGRWHHIAATWDHSRAHLQLFVDGELVASEGPGDEPWPHSMKADGPEEFEGQGISDDDKRSIPMQAFFGGRMAQKVWPPGDAVEAVLDEARISDVVRYDDDFTPEPAEFEVDDNTRALWHFENTWDGVHGGDDRFVRSYAGCELHPQKETVPLEVLTEDGIEQRQVLVKPHAPESLFEKNRGDNNLYDRWSEHPEVPDPRFVDYRRREVERTVTGEDDAFALDVGGDYEPLMQWVTFQPAEKGTQQTTLLPRWRANDNVVPFSVDSLRETLGTDAQNDTQKAFAAMQYVLNTTAYYDAHYCETLPSGRHRGRVSYVFLKALNVYPYDQCGPANFTLRKLFLSLGISSNNSPGTHHQFQQAYYDGDWRLYDLASRMYWLERDNESVIGLREVGEDPFCKLRQPGNLNSYFPGRGGGPPFGTAQRPHNMDFPMRAGEEVSICWQNEGRWFELAWDREPISLANIPPHYANGTIVCHPTEGSEATELTNMSLSADDGSVSLDAQDAREAAALIYRVESPYIFGDAQVSGTYQAREPETIALSLSFDQGESWTEVWRNSDTSGELAANLRDEVMAYYAYALKLEFGPDSEARVTDLSVRSTFVASPLSLPGELSLGENQITFVAGPVSAPVKTRCSWVERHESDLGISLNSLSYYTLDHRHHRNLFIVPPDGEFPLEVTAHGRPVEAEVTLEGLPDGWSSEPRRQMLRSGDPGPGEPAPFAVTAVGATEGETHGFEIVVRDGAAERRVPAAVMVADAPLAREVEAADDMSGAAETVEMPQLSGARGVRFDGDGEVNFEFTSSGDASHILWLRGRWESGTRSALTVQVDDGESREVRASTMIGFGDWTSPDRAYTKGFVHYPDQAEQWTWYRIVGPELDAGEHTLRLAAGEGACFDAVVMLPQTPDVDRAATNLLANWNYAPWDNPQ